jgi:putative membrane protein
MRRYLLPTGCFALACVWLVPWQRVAGEFTAHMIEHVGVVAIAAPLIALGVAGRSFDPVRHAPRWFPPIPLSIVEMLVVWAWHAPALHHSARHSAFLSSLEQLSFLIRGLLVWLSAFGGGSLGRAERRASGLIALLLTFMHMTLLGALLALSPRALYHTAGSLADQHIGGALMLVVGGVSYLAGGGWLAFDILRARREEYP